MNTVETEEPKSVNRVAAFTEQELVDRGIAASANQRINIPMRVDRWSVLPAPQQELLVWFHQYCIDQEFTLDDAGEALGYERSVAHRVLSGVYGPPTGKGSWDNITKAIESFKKLVASRSEIQQSDFTPNSISRLIWGGLDYALANNSITTIVGESGQGKSLATRCWRDANNHGRSVLITAPVVGRHSELLKRIVKAVGAGWRGGSDALVTAAYRGFNKHRILIIDEAHRLLPSRNDRDPIALEVLRDIHDATGCALALISTERFHEQLRKEHSYQYEQVLGRIGLPVRLPRLNQLKDIEPIVKQYVKRPTQKMLESCLAMSNETGRIRIVVERLKVGSRIATKAGRPMCEEDFFKALAIVKQMGGETLYAAKEAR